MIRLTQSAWAVEYTADLQRCKCLGYDSKQSDDEASLMLELRCHRSQIHFSPKW